MTRTTTPTTLTAPHDASPKEAASRTRPLPGQGHSPDDAALARLLAAPRPHPDGALSRGSEATHGGAAPDDYYYYYYYYPYIQGLQVSSSG